MLVVNDKNLRADLSFLNGEIPISPNGGYVRASILENNNFHLEMNVNREQLIGSGLSHYFKHVDFSKVELSTSPNMIGLKGIFFINLLVGK